jgi:hypothetical protein
VPTRASVIVPSGMPFCSASASMESSGERALREASGASSPCSAPIRLIVGEPDFMSADVNDELGRLFGNEIHGHGGVF